MNKIIIWVVGVFFLQNVFAGNSVGNGGDSVAIEFVKTAQKVVALLKTQKMSRELVDAVAQIELHVGTTYVTSIRVLQLNGKDVDAINYPSENKITVSQIVWYFIKQQEITSRIALVFHKYLGVSGISDKEYQISLKLAQLIAGQIKFEPTAKDRFIDQLSCLRHFELEVKSAINFADSLNQPLVPTIFCKNLGAAFACASFVKGSISENLEWFTENQRDLRKMQDSLEVFMGKNHYCSSDVLQIDLKKELKFLEKFDLQIKRIFDLLNELEQKVSQ